MGEGGVTLRCICQSAYFTAEAHLSAIVAKGGIEPPHLSRSLP